MKIKAIFWVLIALVTSYSRADTDITITPNSTAAEGLDLIAVGELFKQSKNIEAFELALNNPATGINNLDLDGNNQVDFIRVVAEVDKQSHVLILQAALGADEFQDVATIEVEKEGKNYNVQISGHVKFYGPNYYIVSTHVYAWPVITWIYRPNYRPYRSIYYFGFYPKWWRPYNPVHINVYRTKTVRLTTHNTFVVTKTRRVSPVKRVVYKPRVSTKVNKSFYVKNDTTVYGKANNNVTLRKTTTKTNATKTKGVNVKTSINTRGNAAKNVDVKNAKHKSTNNKTTKTKRVNHSVKKNNAKSNKNMKKNKKQANRKSNSLKRA